MNVFVFVFVFVRGVLGKGKGGQHASYAATLVFVFDILQVVGVGVDDLCE